MLQCHISMSSVGFDICGSKFKSDLVYYLPTVEWFVCSYGEWELYFCFGNSEIK